MHSLRPKYILLLVFILISMLGNTQSFTHEKENLKETIAKEKGDSKALSLTKLAKYYVNDNKDSALFFLNKSLEEVQSASTKTLCYLEIINFHKYFNNQTQLSIALDSALFYSKDAKDYLKATLLHEKNILLTDKGLYQQALEVALEALKIREKIGDKDEELNAILQVGFTYDRMEDYHTAIKWYQKGLQLKGATNENYIGRNYGLIGIAYDELKEYDKAIHYNLIAVSHFKKVPNSSYLPTWYSNLGNTYTKIGNLELAEKYTLTAIKLNKTNNVSPYLNLAKIYIEKKQFQKAEEILIEKIKALEAAGPQRFLAEAYFRLYELNKKRENYKEALSYFEKYKKTEDERLEEDKILKIKEFSIQYESQEKEKMILSQLNKIKSDQLKIKNRNLLILGLASTTSIIGLIGLNFYRKQTAKNNSQKQESLLKLTQQEMANEKKLTDQRTHIARDLHDNIGAHLTFIISSLDSLNHNSKTNDNPLLVNKIEQINQFTKDTIKELRDSIWAINQDAISIQDLRIRITNFIDSVNIAVPKINVDFIQLDKEEQEMKFSSTVGINIYRILQEALNNAIKHAKASLINITFKTEKNLLTLTIEDNGIGFDLNKVKNESNGLQNIKNRTKLLKGTLQITSVNPGTLVTCTFPYSELKK